MENTCKVHKSNITRKYNLMTVIAAIALFSSTALITPSSLVYAGPNTIEDFGEDTGTTLDNKQSGTDQPDVSQEQPASSSEHDNQAGQSDTDESVETITNQLQNNGNSSGGSDEYTVSVVDPNAYSYQTNPASNEVVVPTDQKINTAVKSSFSQGVPNIAIEAKVKDPANVVKTYTGTTDSNGRNTIKVPVLLPGTWTAEIIIKSPPVLGGPFTDTISWKAISPQNPPSPPNQPALQYDSKISYQTVDRSNDPRQQILTTVKDSNGAGVKDVKITIKLTNADGQSATFSRITDTNGVDEFVTPVEKDGDWKAAVSVKDSAGNVVYTKEHTWKAIP